MITISMVMHFLGGLGLFLYGVSTTSDGLQRLAANRLKNILASLTKKSWVATLFGIVMTVALQSSAATTVMVVEFVNAGLMTLVQALGVSLGSAVGTSVVIQLISFPILDIALFLLFIGFILYLIIKTPVAKNLGRVFIGFGCIFVGMAYLSGAFAPLKNSPEVYSFLSQFGQQPVLGILISIVLTALMQSSAAFLAILISLSSQGLLTIEAIVPLVMGAHIGGTMTTLISSLGAERIDAKRVAIANSIYRIFAAILLLPFFPYFAKLIEWSAADLPRQVANTHLFSAALMVIIFLPLNSILAKALIKFVPQHKIKTQERSLIYITKASLELPTVALNQASQEIRWLGNRILYSMLQIIPRVMSGGENRYISEIQLARKEVDWHYTQLTNFLNALSRRSMTRQQIVENHDLLLIAKELENIAHSLESLALLGFKINHNNIYIAENNWIRLEELYVNVSENYLAFLRCLDKWDISVAIQVIENHKGIIKDYNILQSNISSCDVPSQEGLSEGQNALIDLANWLYILAEHINSMAKVIQSWQKEK
ncbi:MAG: phosphate transporter [Gracilibacter sp. BRH_c7a]|nr:MAG: phosphate transporter [Gracilibacter sp. BRH_c7a]